MLNVTKELLARIREGTVIPQNVRKVLHLASAIVNKIPNKQDNVLQKITKSVAIIDDLEKSFGPDRSDDLQKYVLSKGLVPRASGMFPNTFFDTDLKDEFITRRFTMNGQFLIEATSKKYGTLLFVERYEKAYGTTFYHDKGFEFSKLLDVLWQLYDGRVHIETSWERGTTYCTFSFVKNPLYGGDRERLEKVISRHRKYQLDGMSRSYMFYGNPGTGKTSFAHALVDRLGNRTMRVDARSFMRISVPDALFLIDAMHPDFIIIDDIDKADTSTSLPTILSIMQEIKVHKCSTSVILTANQVDSFDKGLMRPGRIDTWMKFESPGNDTRKTILRSYLGELNVHINEEDVDWFVAETDGLTQDYIREIAHLLKYEELNDVKDTIKSMKALLALPQKK